MVRKKGKVKIEKLGKNNPLKEVKKNQYVRRTGDGKTKEKRETLKTIKTMTKTRRQNTLRIGGKKKASKNKESFIEG